MPAVEGINPPRPGFLYLFPMNSVSTTDFVRLRNRLCDLINLEEGQVLFIPVCGKCVQQIEALGRPTEAADARDIVIMM